MIVLTFELFIGHFTGQNMVSHLEEKIANSEALLFECIKELNNITTRTSALFDMLGPLLVFFPFLCLDFSGSQRVFGELFDKKSSWKTIEPFWSNENASELKDRKSAFHCHSHI